MLNVEEVYRIFSVRDREKEREKNREREDISKEIQQNKIYQKMYF